MPASVADCGDREVPGRHAEIRLRGRLDPVRAVAEVHRVQVLRQDRLLLEGAFDLDREEDLAHLLLHRARRDHVVRDPVLALDVPPRVHPLDQLLGDRRTALDGVPRDEVAPRGADRPLQVDPVVLVEARVLHGDHRVPKVRRHLPQRDDRAVDRAVERREQLAVAIGDERRLDRRERLRQVDAHVGDRQDGEPEEQDSERGQREGPPVATEEPLLPKRASPLRARSFRCASPAGLRASGRGPRRRGGCRPGGRRRVATARLLPCVTGSVVLGGSSGGRGHDRRILPGGFRPETGGTARGVSRRRRGGAP